MSQHARFQPIVLHVRGLLLGRGFRYCDSDDAEVQRSEEQWAARERAAAAVLGGCDANLLVAGVAASTTDHEEQSIDNTLRKGYDFWSSSGSSSQDVQETLLYRLASPACRVRAVQVAIYRARYQYGEPLYPAHAVSVEVGPTPWALQRAVGPQPLALTDALQTVLLPPGTAMGGYLQLTLWGKRQQQLDDYLYYVAVRRVVAHGERMSVPQVRRLSQLAALPTSHLQGGCGVPGTALDPPPGAARRSDSEQVSSSSGDADGVSCSDDGLQVVSLQADGDARGRFLRGKRMRAFWRNRSAESSGLWRGALVDALGGRRKQAWGLSAAAMRPAGEDRSF